MVVSMLLCVSSAWAQKIKVEVNAPSVVAVGEAFRIEFAVNAEPQNFVPPTFTGFDVIAGPTSSQSQSVSIVNNNMTKTVQFAYTYVLMPKTEGKFTIPAVSMRVDGKDYYSQPTIIEVTKADAMPGNGGGFGADNSESGSAQSSASIAEDDILIRAIVNRNSVYKGQPVRVTFKLFTRVSIRNVENAKFPAFNGFWTQDLNVDGYEPRRETYNNKVYETHVLKESLLFPQQAGKLYIEPMTLTAIAQIVRQNARTGSLFDDFFGGGQTVQAISRTVSSHPVMITVKDLPSGAPSSFTGAVGRYQINGEVDKTALPANSSGVYKVQISGIGNLPLIQAPKVTMPTSFEQYNMKTTESLTNNANGISGYRQFEYPFIPRAQGDYTINPVEFSYFDPDGGKYVTLSTQAQSISVSADSTGGAATRGVVSGINKEDLKILDKDIRFIRIGNPHLRVAGTMFLGSWSYILIIILLLIIFVVVYIYLKRYLKEQSNTVLIRNKKANKVALARLKAAQSFMAAGSEDRFYEEMLKALWGYMSDKLNIPVSNLTKDNIREELARRKISQDYITKFIGIISECEYAQYSPSTSGQMTEIYNTAAAMLSKFESLIKK